MSTVMQTIQRLLPRGSWERVGDAPARVSWSIPPRWPPDLFAVCATLVNLSGCYAHAAVTGGTEAAPGDADFPARVQRLGRAWRERRFDKELMATLGHHWKVIIQHGHRPLGEALSGAMPPWCSSALELMAIADEACAGMGFEIFAEARGGVTQSESQARRRAATLCELVPPEECCVQPKTRTPQVGCTLRSLSHYVALLPPIGEVTTSWLNFGHKPRVGVPLNLLLIPYPYAVGDDAVVGYGTRRAEKWGRFSVNPHWFPPGNFAASSEALALFVDELVVEAERAGVPVHGVVMPELSLDEVHENAIAQALMFRDDLSMFVAGVLARRKGRPPKNCAITIHYAEGVDHAVWTQAKHHRWRLEKSQIDRYRLPLSPDDYEWWEDIDVANRTLTFVRNNDDGCIAVLICEDLARIDPVQPVLRAVGPNLVLALLMDGRQLAHRWSARYATALADDPGCSVLTFTSAALIDRSPPPAGEPYEIGIWKDARGVTESVGLPEGHHAVLLSLRARSIEERTLDRRSDGGAALQYELDWQRAVAHPRPPAWLAPRKERR